MAAKGGHIDFSFLAPLTPYPAAGSTTGSTCLQRIRDENQISVQEKSPNKNIQLLDTTQSRLQIQSYEFHSTLNGKR